MPMTRDTFAVWTLLVSFVVATIGTTMFYDHVMGLSYAIFFVLIVAAVLGSGWYAKRPMNRRNLWPIVPALFFALMFAVRADDWLRVYNVGVSLVLAGLALHYMALKTPFDKTSTLEQLIAFIATLMRGSIEGPSITIEQSVRWFNNRSSGDSKRALLVLRGVLITLPVLAVFGILLGQADAVFGQYIQRIQDWFDIDNIDELIARAFLTAVLMWIVVGIISYGLARIWQPTADEHMDLPGELADDDAPLNTEEDGSPRKRDMPRFFSLSMIESGMLLGSVNLLFIAFGGVQFVYLFGGQQNIALDGFTYAEYARRGFFELVTVSVLTLALLLVADRLTVRDGAGEMRLFRGLALLMVALVGVMLVSAARRMGLYTEAFGLTRLRLWTSVFMAWLAMLFVVQILALFRVRQNVFSFGLVLVGVGFFVTMNVINADARIAAHNIDRAISGELEWDTCYLSYLSADAIPVMVDRYEQHNVDELGVLLHQLYTSRTRYIFGTDDSVFAYNHGHAQAKAAINSVLGRVSEYDISDNPYECYNSNGYYYTEPNRYE